MSCMKRYFEDIAYDKGYVKDLKDAKTNREIDEIIERIVSENKDIDYDNISFVLDLALWERLELSERAYSRYKKELREIKNNLDNLVKVIDKINNDKVLFNYQKRALIWEE